jgi:hypothetical protein
LTKYKAYANIQSFVKTKRNSMNAVNLDKEPRELSAEDKKAETLRGLGSIASQSVGEVLDVIPGSGNNEFAGMVTRDIAQVVGGALDALQSGIPIEEIMQAVWDGGNTPSTP